MLLIKLKNVKGLEYFRKLNVFERVVIEKRLKADHESYQDIAQYLNQNHPSEFEIIPAFCKTLETRALSKILFYKNNLLDISAFRDEK